MRRALLWLSVAAWLAGGASAAVQSPAPNEEARLRFAAAQHEIITILVREGQYDRVVEEFQKILALGFAGPQEELVVRETWAIVKGLMEQHAYDTAHRVVESALQTLKSDDSHFALLMLRGKLFKEQGRLREALEAYRQAQRLQQQRP
ncbi:MAG: hypothetical protein Kow00109_11020 [Acidobacteriota bacterium]